MREARVSFTTVRPASVGRARVVAPGALAGARCFLVWPELGWEPTHGKGLVLRVCHGCSHVVVVEAQMS